MKKRRKRGRKPKPLEITWEHCPSPDSEFRIQQAFRMLLENVTESELDAVEQKPQDQERRDQET